IFTRRIDTDAGTELLRERDFLVAEVDHDNRMGTQIIRRLNDTQADATSADHGHGLAGAHVGGIHRGATARHDSAPDDGSDVHGDIRISQWDHILLIGNHRLRPGEDARRRTIAVAYRLALISGMPGGWVRRMLIPVTLHPG